jgi:gas vesicle protein
MAENSTGNTIIALLTGAIVGVGVGMLFAPDKGVNTRKKIKEGIDDTTDEVSDKYHELVSLLKGKATAAKNGLDESVDHMIQSGSHKAEEVIEALEKKLADLKKANAKLQK